MINSFFQPSFNPNETKDQHIFGARRGLQMLVFARSVVTFWDRFRASRCGEAISHRSVSELVFVLVQEVNSLNCGQPAD